MIRRSGYSGMDWLSALQSRPKEPTKDLGEQKEADLVDNALETTAQIAFNLSPKTENKNEALIRASKEIADKKVVRDRVSVTTEIKNKIASSGIDPVTLGVASKETWETYVQAGDVTQVEKIATKAALEFEKQAKTQWEKTANQPAQHLSSKFNPETMRDGKIMSATAAGEETRGQISRVPVNATSILNPNKLDELAKAENAHDKAVTNIRDAGKQRIEEKKAQYKVEDTGPAPMKAGQVVKAGGEDRDVFVQRTPRNQVSMLDVTDNQKLSPDQIKEQLSKLFTRVEDNGQKIKEANKEHKESIQGKKEPDRSWETLQKPTSTSDLAKKLAEQLWPSPKQNGQ